MTRTSLVLLVVPLIALWIVACDGESPSAPEATPETTALFGKNKVPTDPTACYSAGMAALEAAEAYGEAAKELAKCDQNAKGPCDVEQEAHITAWLELSDLYESALAICGGEPPSENLPPEISSVDISPNPAYPDTPELTCQAVYSDPDGDDLSVSYKWLKDGSATAAVANVYPGPFLTGELYTCEVTVSDGQAQDVTFGELFISEPLCDPSETESRECPYGDPEIRICQGNGLWGPWSGCIEPNTPPYVIRVTITPSNPTTATSSLLCSAADVGDADGDNVTVSYAWFGPGDLSSETSNVLSLGGVVVGQQFYCAITADDGTDQTTEQSEVVTIADSDGLPPPSVSARYDAGLGVTVSWTAVPNAASYRVSREPGNDLDPLTDFYVEVSAVSVNSFFDQQIDLVSGQTYAYSVAAVDQNGVPGGYGTGVQVTIP